MDTCKVHEIQARLALQIFKTTEVAHGVERGFTGLLPEEYDKALFHIFS